MGEEIDMNRVTGLLVFLLPSFGHGFTCCQAWLRAKAVGLPQELLAWQYYAAKPQQPKAK